MTLCDRNESILIFMNGNIGGEKTDQAFDRIFVRANLFMSRDMICRA